MGIEIEKYKENKISPYLYYLLVPFSYTGADDNVFRRFRVFTCLPTGRVVKQQKRNISSVYLRKSASYFNSKGK